MAVLVAAAGGVLTEIYKKNGKPAVRKGIRGYDQAARTTGTPWVVLLDLDRDADCAVPFCRELLCDPAPTLCLRVAVRAVEAWLLADAERLAGWFRVSPGRIPPDPEALPDPKRAFVDLCRRSRSSRIKAAMVPRPGSGRAVGAGYTNEVIDFVTDPQDGWRPGVAAGRADSLRRAFGCIGRLVHNP